MYGRAIVLAVLSLLSTWAVAQETPVIGAALSMSGVGRQITITYTLENLGNVDLNTVTVSADLDAVFGAGNYSFVSGVSATNGLVANGSFDGSGDTALLSSGNLLLDAIGVITVVVSVDTPTNQGSGLGVFTHQITASASGPTVGPVTDLSDNGTEPDTSNNDLPNDAGEDDPTVYNMFENAVIGAAKNATLDNNQVTLDFYLLNDGNVIMSNLSLVDDLDAVFGAGNYTITSGPSFVDDPGTITLNGSYNGSGDTELISSGTLAASDTSQIQLVLTVDTVTDQGNGNGVYSNQATFTGLSPNLITKTDLSNNGTNPDPSLSDSDTPTPIFLGEEPVLGVANNATLVDNVITYDLYLENLGNADLTRVTLVDDLDATFGSGNWALTTAPVKMSGPNTININENYNGSTDTDILEKRPEVNGGPEYGSSSLLEGETAQIQMVITVLNLSDQGNGLGVYHNQASVTGTAPSGAVVTDLSDNGTDPDPNANNEPNENDENDVTVTTIVENASLGVALEAGRDGTRVTFTYTVTNLGNVVMGNLSMTADYDAVFGAANYNAAFNNNTNTGIRYIQDPGSTVLETSFNGSANQTIFNGGYLNPGDSVVVMVILDVFVVTDQGFGLGVYQHQVTVSGDSPAPNNTIDTDLSNDGGDPDPNNNGEGGDAGEDTVTVLTYDNYLGVALAMSNVGNQVTLDYYLESFSPVTVSNLSMSHSLDPVFGAGNYTIVTPPTLVDDPGTIGLNGSFDGSTDDFLLGTASLTTGATAQIRTVVELNNIISVGNGLGVYSTQVTISGTDANGQVLQDDSDSGTDPDENVNNNPTDDEDVTTLSITPGAIVGAALTSSNAGLVVTLDIYLDNLGAETANPLSVDFDLDSVFGSGNYAVTTPPSLVDNPGTITLNGAWDGSATTEMVTGSTLVATGTAQIQLVVTVSALADPDGNGSGVYSGQVTATGTDSAGIVYRDLSHGLSTDPDHDSNNDPTTIISTNPFTSEDDPTTIFAGFGDIGLTQYVTTNGSVITFNLYIENLGNIPLEGIAIDESLNDEFGSGNFSVTSSPTVVAGATTIGTNNSFFGNGAIPSFDFILSGGSLGAYEWSHVQYEVTISNAIDPDALGVGVYSSSITVTATEGGVNALTDISDEGIFVDPNDNDNANEAGENDPTIIELNANPTIGLSIDDTVVGSQVTLDFYLENFGAGNLDTFSMALNLDNIFGSGNYTISSHTFQSNPGTLVLNGSYDGSGNTEFFDVGGNLPNGNVAQIRLVVDVTNITDQGSGLGVYSVQTDVNAFSANNQLTYDLSDDGTDPDASGDGDPTDSTEGDATVLSLSVEEVGVALDVTVSGRQVTFDYYVSNIGNLTLSSISMAHDLDAIFGAGNYEIVSFNRITAPRSLDVNTGFNGSTDTELFDGGTMNAGFVEQFSLVINVNLLTDPGAGLGVHTTQVSISAEDPSMMVVVDTSDDGTDPDPNGNGKPDDAGENDASTFTVGQDPAIGVAKTASVSGGTVTFDYYLENLANTDLSNLALNDDFDTLFGAGNYSITSGPTFTDDPSTITLNGGFNGSGDTSLLSGTLSHADTAAFRVVLEVAQLIDGGSGLGVYSSQVTATADTPNATMGSDTSDDGTDPDPDGDNNPNEAGENDATNFTIPQNPVIGIANTVSVSTRTVTITYYLENFGNCDIQSLSVVDDLDTTFGAGNYTVTSAPSFVSDPGGITLDAAFDGSANNDLISVGTLGYGLTGAIQVVVDVNTVTDQGGGVGVYTQRASASGQSADATATNDNADSGTDPDPNGNASPGDVGEDDTNTITLNGSIGDLVFNDLNGNGVLDGGEAGITNVVVYVDLNSNNSLDGGETSDTTDGSGAYDLLDLAAGTYNVRIDSGSIPAGFVQINTPAAVVLANGGDDNATDFGLQQQDASIGDFVYNDLTGNGTFDGSDFGIAGVTVDLIDDANGNGAIDGGETVLSTTTTDANGAYSFDNLPTGDYIIDFTDTGNVLTGFVITAGSAPTAVTGLAAGGVVTTADLGLQQADAIIGNFLYNDLNGNGAADAGEPGLDGVTLSLYSDDNASGTLDGGDTLIGNTTTAGGGAYAFTGLVIGDYLLDVTDTGAVLAVFVNTTGGEPVLISNLTAGEGRNTVDIGYQQQNAVIGDFIFTDFEGDGSFDGADTALAGVTVDLYLDNNSDGIIDGGDTYLATDTTDAGGLYSFGSLPTGNYLVTVTDTGNVLTGFVLTGGTEPAVVALAAGENYAAADFGFQQQDASIGDLIFNDLAGDGAFNGSDVGIAGVTVDLINDTNASGTLDGADTVVTTATTDANGNYTFANLPKGNYLVDVTDTGSVLTGFVLTSGANPSVVSALTAGQVYTTADIGYQQQDASIGDLIYNDLNGNGAFDAEPGISGVTVDLIDDANGNGAIDGGEAVLSTQTTDANGAYSFDNLPTGDYLVNVTDTGNALTGFVLTAGVNPTSVMLSAGEVYTTADVGYQQQDASIGDLVYNDLDGDGSFNGSDVGIAGVTLDLIDDANANGVIDGGEAVLSTQTTDANGAYSFNNLPLGDYIVSVTDTGTVLTGFVLTGGTAPLQLNLTAGQTVTAADFGYQQQDASIGDLVYDDLNGNGTLDGGEPGIPGVVIDLYTDLDSSGTLSGGDQLHASATTDANGAYTFSALPKGNYIVYLNDNPLVNSGYILTAGTSPGVVSGLTAGQVYTDADFGYQKQNASIGDLIFNDLNGDGIFDAGEPGLVGITLDLIRDTNGNGVIDAGEPIITDRSTDGSGIYTFNNLPIGDYLVNVTDVLNSLNGFVLTAGVNPIPVTLTVSEVYTTADLGYQQQDASIGDLVYNDLNGNGVLDGSEPGLANVTLDLIRDENANGTIDAGEPVLSTQTTDANGNYRFVDLPLGSYIVNLTDTNTALTGFVQTGGTNPQAVTKTAGQVVSDIDFGYQQQDASIGDLVFNDLDGNGVQDGGEPGFANVTVDLIRDDNANGTIDAGEPVLDTQTTDANGLYGFADLPTGDYIVNVTDTNNALTGFLLTAGINPLPVTKAAGQVVVNADFGYQQTDASIGDFVWNDTNGDGVQDAGEPGFANVTIELYKDVNGDGAQDGGDVLMSTQTTDANGAYNFIDLTLGRYLVVITDTNAVLTDYTLTGGTAPSLVDLSAGQVFTDADFGYCLPVRITTQPLPVDICLGETYDFIVENTGDGNVTYQWFKDDAPLTGETAAILSISPVVPESAGSYKCTVTNGCGEETTETVELTLTTPIRGISVSDESNEIEIVILIDANCHAIYDLYAQLSDGSIVLVKEGVEVFPNAKAQNRVVIPFIPDATFFLSDPNGPVAPVGGVVSVNASVPTLGTWALILFCTLFLAMGVAHSRRQRQM